MNYNKKTATTAQQSKLVTVINQPRQVDKNIISYLSWNVKYERKIYMENSVVINQKPMNIKEYKGQRVLTFKDIDTVHGRPDGTASRNFKANRKHFIEGIDFYNIQKDEIRLIGITSPRGAIAITESGYLMLAKSLTDELAWKVQRELVNNYFRVKSQQSCRQMTFEDYSYFDKRFRGKPVLSLADISAMLNIDRSALGYSVRRYLKQGQDFYLLEKTALAEFKLENPKVFKHIGSMYVVTESGFDKLCRMYGVKVDKPKVFIEEKPTAKAYEPTNSMKSLLGYLDRDMILINEYRRRILNANSVEDAQQSRTALAKAMRSLRQYTVDVESIMIK